MKTSGKCVHYNGTMNDRCEAGVNYKQLAGPPDYGWVLRLPCFSPAYRTGSGMTLARADQVCECPHRKEPTAEEIEADRKVVEERFEWMAKARAAIVSHLGGPWKKGMHGAHGSIPCPCCGTGKLNFSRAGYNGHIHASCTTKTCVSWME